MGERTESLATGGVEIAVECFEPEGTGPYPALVALHGSNGMTNGAPLVRAFALPVVGAGFAVYLPHYFERTGTRRSDPETSRRNFLPWMQAVADTVGFASIQPKVDAARIGIIGMSLGAFLGLAVASEDARVKAVVDFFGGLPEPFAGRFETMAPTLILHGAADRIVPVSEAHKLEAALAARGVPHETKIYEGEGHIFSPLAGLDAARRTMQFLGRYLGSRPR
jgi:carboxymethylenebutenolidase